MSVLLGAIADDFTGATDLCNTLVRRSMRGPVVAGASLDAAVNAIEELEETARLYLLLRGAKTRFLTPAQVTELLL